MNVTKLITVVMIGAALTACGVKEAESPAAETEITIETTGTAAAGKEEITAAETKSGVQPAVTEENKETAAEEAKTEKAAESQEEQKTESNYEDNFAVDTRAAAEFAEKIKAAVAARDIEALADLTFFPVYVGIAEGGVETREAFIALGAEKVFTPGLMEAVGGADTSNLLPSMAGFTISNDGKSNIIFGVVEGRLVISGINYE